jgi:hypothetical protein
VRQLSAGALAFTVVVVSMAVAATHGRDERGAGSRKDDAVPGLVSSGTSVRRVEIADLCTGTRNGGSGAAARSASGATLSAAAISTGASNGARLAAQTGAAAGTKAAAAAGIDAAATRAGHSSPFEVGALDALRIASVRFWRRAICAPGRAPGPATAPRSSARPCALRARSSRSRSCPWSPASCW